MEQLSTEEEYLSIVGDLIEHPLVQELKLHDQHGDATNCFEHSLYVSYMSFLACKKLHLNARAAARAGLLHDMHLNRWEGKRPSRLVRLVKHAKLALFNAKSNFELSELECDIIEKHMWPATPFKIPVHRESFLVNFVDTYCAIVEFMGMFQKSKATHLLAQFSN